MVFFMTKTQIQQLISFIDLTTLGNKDNEKSVRDLIVKANKCAGGIAPAAVCIFPQFGDFAKGLTDIQVAVVGGCFPTGQTSLEAKAAELRIIALSSVDEVDIVINRGEAVAENWDYLANEVKQARDIIGEKKLKVILESGELTSSELQMASMISIENGADFIKTSTGKIEIGATPEAAEIMCQEIHLANSKTAKKVGFKASGGIRTFQDAMLYHDIILNKLGEEWLTPELFRIGASSLYDNLINDLNAL